MVGRCATADISNLASLLGIGLGDLSETEPCRPTASTEALLTMKPLVTVHLSILLIRYHFIYRGPSSTTHK